MVSMAPFFKKFPLSTAALQTLAKSADVIFDGAANCMTEETLAYLKNEFASGTIKLSPWKISKTIRRAYETLGETLEKADIDIILENLGMLTEERLLNELILRRVSGCMDDKAYQWLLEKMAERNISAAQVRIVEFWWICLRKNFLI